MPGSSPDFKIDIRNHLLSKFPTSATILDIGAGQGTYYNLLHDYFLTIDAIEIHLPYIIQYQLMDKYSHVFRIDCTQLLAPNYDIFILGDVLEHLSIEQAQGLINRLYPLCKEMIISVPYLCKQGAAHENSYEIHQQDDLTPDIMSERYLLLKLWKHNNKIGVYLKS